MSYGREISLYIVTNEYRKTNGVVKSLRVPADGVQSRGRGYLLGIGEGRGRPGYRSGGSSEAEGSVWRRPPRAAVGFSKAVLNTEY